MAGSTTIVDYGSGGSLSNDGVSMARGGGEQRCVADELLAEFWSSGQVENGTASTSPPFWDTDDDDDGIALLTINPNPLLFLHLPSPDHRPPPPTTYLLPHAPLTTPDYPYLPLPSSSTPPCLRFPFSHVDYRNPPPLSRSPSPAPSPLPLILRLTPSTRPPPPPFNRTLTPLDVALGTTSGRRPSIHLAASHSTAVNSHHSGASSLPHHRSPRSTNTFALNPDGSSGDEFNKDTIERDERRLTEFGRRVLDFFIIAHIFGKIEVAYQEAVALKRQEELIREEEAAEQAENELKAKRRAAEKEKTH